MRRGSGWAAAAISGGVCTGGVMSYTDIEHYENVRFGYVPEHVSEKRTEIRLISSQIVSDIQIYILIHKMHTKCLKMRNRVCFECSVIGQKCKNTIFRQILPYYCSLTNKIYILQSPYTYIHSTDPQTTHTKKRVPKQILAKYRICCNVLYCPDSIFNCSV